MEHSDYAQGRTFADRFFADSRQSENKQACSAFAAGKKAARNGRTLCAYTSDGVSDFRVRLIPAADHAPGEKRVIDYPGIEGGFGHDARWELDEVSHTFAYYDSEVPFANEHQVFISENTCASKAAASDRKHEDALIDWHTLPQLALERSCTADEAVRWMGKLVSRYGLRGAAESFLVCDAKEVWLFEAVGDSTVWAAVRCPDDCVIFHANRLRIGELSGVCRYSENVITNAIEKKLYSEADGPFDFEKVYSDNRTSLNCIRREWRASDLICPSRKYLPNAISYPLFLKPEIPIDRAWIMNSLWRDALEGTSFDPSVGTLAGPFHTPLRQSIKGASGCDRYISTSRIAYATVCEAADIPEKGLTLFSADTPRNGTYLPLFCGADRIPDAFSRGDYKHADDDSLFWAFQKLDTLCSVRYSDMHKDVRTLFDALESEQETELAELLKKPDVSREALSAFTERRTLKALGAAKETLLNLFARYRDGEPEGEADEEWLSIYKKYTPSDNADEALIYLY